MPKTQISCPRCNVPLTAEIQQLFDVNTDPQAKQKLLNGSANVIQCQACGFQGLYPTPIVYHDPEKEMLLTYFPPELGISINEQEKMVGPLINRAVNDLPMENRKAYLFQAQSMLTYQTLMEKILEADGVTKEMLDNQQKKLQLIQRLLTTQNAESRKEIIKQEEELIDETFFGMLNRLVEATIAQGDKQSAEQLALFQQELLQDTKVGQEIQEKMKSSQKAMEDLQEAAKAGLTREKLLDIFIDAPDEIYTNTLVGMVRSGLDYEFFQILSQRIETATEGDQKDKLTNLRDFLLDITKKIDEQIQEEKNLARSTLNKILAEPNIESGLEKFGSELNDFFIEAVREALEEARKSSDLDRITKLNQLNTMIKEANQPPAEIQFVESLLQAPDTDTIKGLINEKPEILTDEFIQLLTNLINQTEQQGNQQTLVDKLKDVQKVATKMLMAKNLKG
ncbi:MAG TPA: CpXC domain-containing protein [Anaerolineaceae bacterium]|nr:CpXC domain-containing protein [Anaerolineaceae bacterium]